MAARHRRAQVVRVVAGQAALFLRPLRQPADRPARRARCGHRASRHARRRSRPDAAVAYLGIGRGSLASIRSTNSRVRGVGTRPPLTNAAAAPAAFARRRRFPRPQQLPVPGPQDPPSAPSAAAGRSEEFPGVQVLPTEFWQACCLLFRVELPQVLHAQARASDSPALRHSQPVAGAEP